MIKSIWNNITKRVNGLKAYELAREGLEFELKSSTMQIFDIKFLKKKGNEKMKKHILTSVLVAVFVMASLVLMNVQDKTEIVQKLVISVLTGAAYFFIFK